MATSLTTGTTDTVESLVLSMDQFQPNWFDNLYSVYLQQDPNTVVGTDASPLMIKGLDNPDDDYTDYLEVDNQTSIIHGGLGDDVIVTTGAAATTIFGGEGNDDITTDSENAIIHGGNGDDGIFVGSTQGTSVIYGGTGDDSITVYNQAIVSGGAGDDSIATDIFDDKVSGGDGNDDISTGGGNDIIYGGAGDDTIDAGDGNDIIVGGTGNDILWGGEGQDTFIFDSHSGNDSIMDFQEGDALQVDANGYNVSVVNTGEDLYSLNWTDNHGNIINSVHIETLGVSSFTTIDGLLVGTA